MLLTSSGTKEDCGCGGRYESSLEQRTTVKAWEKKIEFLKLCIQQDDKPYLLSHTIISICHPGSSQAVGKKMLT
eukprot:1150263-Pelagomonas_calceolata.AAC.1